MVINSGLIRIKGNKVNLRRLNTTNGVDVELQIGADMAVENIDMEETNHNQVTFLGYRRDDGRN